MPTNTPNYNLIKPAENEFYDISQFNQNADIIDTQIKAVNTRVDNSGMSIHGNEFHEPDMALASELTTHANLTTAHSAVATPTANRLMLRDANGRAQVADGVAAGDIASFAQINNLRALIRMGAM